MTRSSLLVAAVVVGVASAQPPAPATVVATVNGEAVRLDQVDAFIRARLPGVPLTASQLKAVRTEITNDLVDDLLVRQFLRKNGPKVDPAEVDRQLAAFTESLTAKGKTLAAYLKETGQTDAGLRDTWGDLVALNAYVRERVPVLELQKYFEAHRDHFDGVEVRAAHVLVRAPGAAVERAAAREKVQAVRAEIVAGRLDFAAAAKKYSHCPSAARGGDLGMIPRKGGLQDEAFAKAAFALKVGEVSPVVETPGGFHLIRVAARTPGTPAAFERCVEDVRDAYADDLRADLLPRLRREAQVSVTVP